MVTQRNAFMLFGTKVMTDKLRLGRHVKFATGVVWQ
jgi:hypothetical protein